MEQQLLPFAQRACSSGECSATARYFCAFPIKKGGRRSQCSRALCDTHSYRAGRTRFYCKAHHNSSQSFIKNVKNKL